MISASHFLDHPLAHPSQLLGRCVRDMLSPEVRGWIIGFRWVADSGCLRGVIFQVTKEKNAPRIDWEFLAERLELIPETTPPEPAEKEVEEAVCDAIRSRRDAGRKKYGTTMERQDLTPLQWLQHAQEEAMDFSIYLEKLRRVLSEQGEELQRLRKENEELRLLRRDPRMHKAIAEGGGPG